VWDCDGILMMSSVKRRLMYVDRVKGGCKALAPLLTIRQVMHQNTLTSVWSSRDELPVGGTTMCSFSHTVCCGSVAGSIIIIIIVIIIISSLHH